ncbi:MAG: site-specific DNA-methyltransferase [Patulibacter minatonensis]
MTAAARVLVGDCVEQMQQLDDASVDAVVTDPPYGIGFMGHEWDQPGLSHRERFEKLVAADVERSKLQRQMERAQRRGSHRPPAVGAGHQRDREAAAAGEGVRPDAMNAGRYDLSPTANRAFQAWTEAWAAEALRVLKPGGHLISFSSTRTYHRMVTGIEDAGFEIRDQIAWLFGSGFPKSLQPRHGMLSLPRSTTRAEWKAWWRAVRSIATGTALKPGHEPVVLARKPLDGTVAQNVLRHGVGALNIDGCRIAAGSPDGVSRDRDAEPTRGKVYARTGRHLHATPGPRGGDARGRWPSNVALDDIAAEVLDEQSGTLASGTEASGGHRRSSDKFGRNTYGTFAGTEVETGVLYGDSGGATAERDAGLGAPTAARRRASNDFGSLHDAEPALVSNIHPTVKPVALMRWLVRMVTPPGGVVLDPFTGSGTTGIAAVLEGCAFIGCERSDEYAAIALARIEWWRDHPRAGDDLRAELAREARERAARERREQRERATAAAHHSALFDLDVA